MKRSVVGLILVGLLLSVGGTPATAGLVDDTLKKANELATGAPSKRDPAKTDPRVSMEFIVDWLRANAHIPTWCHTGVHDSQVSGYPSSGNHDLSATRSCWLRYDGPNLHVEGWSQGWKGIYKEGKMCSGSPVCGHEPAPSQIRVTLLYQGEPLVQCTRYEPNKAIPAHCEEWGGKAPMILTGTLLECRAEVWAPMVVRVEFSGQCQTGELQPID